MWYAPYFAADSSNLDVCFGQGFKNRLNRIELLLDSDDVHWACNLNGMRNIILRSGCVEGALGCKVIIRTVEREMKDELSLIGKLTRR